jgi:hypothetical protein
MSWMVCGDFNLVLRSEERTSQILWPRDRAFRSMVNDLALIDLPLSDRKYTWVNSISKAKLDRFLISQDWNALFSTSTQSSMPTMVSDHCPIICQCSSEFSKSNMFRFENYWLKLPEFQELVINTWQQHEKAVTPSQIQEKLVMLRRCIAHWRRDRLGDINNQEEV